MCSEGQVNTSTQITVKQVIIGISKGLIIPYMTCFDEMKKRCNFVMHWGYIPSP